MNKNIIHITDNCVDGQVIKNIEDINNLSTFLNKSIKQLTEEENLLIFPYSLSEYGDELGPQTIGSLRIVDNESRLYTGNIMGFVGKANTRLRIYSRFGNENDDYFLFYMLCRVLRINVFDLPYSQGDDSSLDMLMLLFPYYLSKAMQQGIYKEYRIYKYNDADIAGIIDINSHIRKNIPFQGNIAYKQRKRSADNSLTQLIRHTIEHVLHHPIGMVVIERGQDIKAFVSQIIEATPTYNYWDRSKIISANLRPQVHPYYSAYQPLQQLCIQILCQEEVSMGTDGVQISGILFDGAWLWEEYLNKTLLHKKQFIHPQNRICKGAIFLFNDETGVRYPDFYNPQTKVVLDAKYKCFENHSRLSDIERSDLHQVITYMHVLQSPLGGYLFPSRQIVTDTRISELKGYGGKMRLYPLYIPTTSSWEDFVKQIHNSEKALDNQLEELINSY